jgi:hypothetical protein
MLGMLADAQRVVGSKKFRAALDAKLANFSIVLNYQA